VQQARNLLMDLEDAFDAVLQAAGVRVVRSAVQAP
jgi:hypothetical protein